MSLWTTGKDCFALALQNLRHEPKRGLVLASALALAGFPLSHALRKAFPPS